MNDATNVRNNENTAPFKPLTEAEKSIMPEEWRSLLRELAAGVRERGIYDKKTGMYTVQFSEKAVAQWEKLSSQS